MIKEFPCGCKTIVKNGIVENKFCEYHRAVYKGKVVVRK